MAVATALLGFNDLGRSVTPTFLFRNRFYLQLSPQCPKMNKKSMWEVKNISRFLPTGHGILPSYGSKASETMVTKCMLFEEPQQLTIKPYLGDNISLQSSNYNILGLAATVGLFANEVRFTPI